jgi:hypothetical protein
MSLNPGELLHMDFAFLDILFYRNFTAILTIVDACMQMIWIFCTVHKKPPIHVLRWFFANLRREKRTLASIRVDEDGALTESSAFAIFLRDEEHLNFETTGGSASFLNGKVERPNRTLAESTSCMLLNAGYPSKAWLCAIEHYVEVNRVTYQYAIKCSPHYAWYGKTLNAKDMHICGCRVLVPAHNIKKAYDRANYGRFHGFSKTRILLRWLHPATDDVKHAYGARFLEIDLPDPNPTIGQSLIALDPVSKTCDLTFPIISIDLGELRSQANSNIEPPPRTGGVQKRNYDG